MALDLSIEDRELCRRRIRAAEREQQKMHRLWYEVLAFCQGHQWVKYSGPNARRLVEVPPPKGGQRYTVDELTQYRLTLAGELVDDDERPQVQFLHDDAPGQSYAQQANDALRYAWEEEIDADSVIQEAVDVMIDLGTCPLRCRYDAKAGASLGDKPFLDGRMVGVGDAMTALDQGQQVDLQTVNEGKLCWERGLPFNVLPPPGVPREKAFRWIVWKSVEDLAETRLKYPGKELVADGVRSLATLSSPQQPATQDSQPETADNLNDKVFIYTYYLYPTSQYPKGRIVVFGSERLEPLETIDQLPYMGPDGDYRPGIYFLHAIRLTDRFWSRGFMELALDPQRAINQHVTRIEQTIAKGQPVRWIEEGSIKTLPDGTAGSVGWLKVGKQRPVADPGLAPGPWMKDAIVMQRENLARSVLPESALGENPQNVTTYSQLALLHSQARKRLAKIVKQKKTTVRRLCEDTAWDIKTKWGPEKQIRLAGVSDGLDAFAFNASQWPDYYKIRFATGVALPKTQEAQIRMIEDMWTAALQSQVALMNPAWLQWRKDSMEAGTMLDLPTPPVDANIAKAQWENQILFDKPDPGVAVQLVDYFDNHAQHVMEHRALQGTCRIMGRTDVFVALELHCKEHERQVLEQAMQAAATQGPTTPPAIGPAQMHPSAPGVQTSSPAPQTANGGAPAPTP